MSCSSPPHCVVSRVAALVLGIVAGGCVSPLVETDFPRWNRKDALRDIEAPASTTIVRVTGTVAMTMTFWAYEAQSDGVTATFASTERWPRVCHVPPASVKALDGAIDAAFALPHAEWRTSRDDGAWFTVDVRRNGAAVSRNAYSPPPKGPVDHLIRSVEQIGADCLEKEW